jgi:hypothetical protein
MPRQAKKQDGKVIPTRSTQMASWGCMSKLISLIGS